MSWIPVEQSSLLNVTFSSSAGYPGTNIPTFNQSVVSALDTSGVPGSYPGAWTVHIENPSDSDVDVQLRISISEYLAQGLPVAALEVSTPTDVEYGPNDSASAAEWLPNPWNAQVVTLPAGEVINVSRVVGEFAADSGKFFLEVFEGSPSTECCPLSGSRLFKGIASAYRAAQHQPVRARRSQKRCLQVDFNGSLDPGESIQRVTWECTSPWITFMESACIGDGGKYVCTDVTFNYPGIGNIKATIDTSSGRRENYEFEITVTDAPMYPSAQYIPSNGPYQLVAEA